MHKKIDGLNIVLILLSLLIAVKIPFKLFLFSYAILGPLHYLTEINWLKEKKYFIKANSKWIRVFTIITALIMIYPLYKLIDFGFNNSIDETIKLIFGKRKILILTAFIFSIGLIFFKEKLHLILTLVIGFLISILLYYFLPKWIFLAGLFLPTIIHVYIFTLLFMVYGSKKSNSKLGYCGSALLLLIPFVIFFMKIDAYSYIVSPETIAIYNEGNFLNLNRLMIGFFDDFNNGKFFVLSPVGIKIQIFIAFAYTYHYLNWFSKTSIIGWKENLTTQKTIYILIIWIAAIGIYFYDYFTGLIALYVLSILHVFLEFPLNIITIKEIFILKKTK